MSASLYIGLMSGTSLDGIDAVAVDFQEARPRLVASHLEPIPDPLREELLALTQPGDNEIDRLGCADARFADLQVSAIHQLLTQNQLIASQVQAIGSHGQTIRHRPEFNPAFTLQIGDPNRIAEQTGITVVADLRRRDMAAGGQGAPLVPAFHEYFLGDSNHPRIVANIGGIANITLIDPQKDCIGYDTGPGNVLMDAWIQRQKGLAQDTDGQWARSGQVNCELLSQLMQTSYLHQPPPKSTGRELFNLEWLQQQLQQRYPLPSAEDIQATLLEFTARSLSDAIQRHEYEQLDIYLCGGGARNRALLARLEALLKPYRVSTTDSLGIPCEWLEACAFAWLAKRCLEGKSGNLPGVTGANGRRILGAIYQA